MLIPLLIPLFSYLFAFAHALEHREVLAAVNLTLSDNQLGGGCLIACQIAVPFLDACFSGNTTGCLAVCNNTASSSGMPPIQAVTGCFICLGQGIYGVVSTEEQYDALNGVAVELGQMCKAFGQPLGFTPDLEPFTEGPNAHSLTTISGTASQLPFGTTTVASGLLVEVTSAVGGNPVITSGTQTFTFSALTVSPTPLFGAAMRPSPSVGVMGLVSVLAVVMGMVRVVI